MVFLSVSPLWVYFILVCATLFHYSPLPITLSPFFNSIQYTSLYPLPSQIICFMILQMFYHSLFLSLFPKFHRIVLLLTNPTYGFEYACFCVYVYLLDLSSTYEIECMAFVFLSLAHFA
jgi:hypothetical protein